MKKCSPCVLVICLHQLLVISPPLLTSRALAAPLSFRQAVELAAQHGIGTTIAAADQERAYQTYVETKSLYLPQMFTGSAIGYSAGFPLSLEGAAPAIFNVASQQFLFNPAQRSFVTSARAQWQASALAQSDQNRHAALDAAIAYVDLSRVDSQMRLLQKQHQATARLIYVETERVRADMDSGVSLTRAKLLEARTRMRSAELEGAALQLRQRLADLTGLPTQEIEPIPDSIPRLPDEAIPNAAKETTDNDLRVKVAVEQAHASDLRAQGEHRLRWLAADLVGQYALLSRFNNYDQFYRKFERNNGTVGVVLRLGFLNPVQRARAREADADAVKAHRQVDVVKSQVSGEALSSQTTVKQLIAARDMAQLEYVLAGIDATKLDVKSEIGAIGLGDQMSGHIAEDAKFESLLDATSELQKAQLKMLNATGDLRDWVMSHVPSPAAEPPVMSPPPFATMEATIGPNITSLMLAPSLTVLPVCKSQQLVAVAIHDDASAKDMTSVAEWSSSSDSIAIVSTSGLVTALRSGQVTITATLSGVSRSLQITITEPQ